MEQLYDLIIIGSGPAGLSAAVYAQRAMLNTVIIEKGIMSGGQIINTYEVDNYLGFQGVSGFDLATKFREHADKLEAKFIEGDVIEVNFNHKQKTVTLGNGSSYEAKAVMIATGAKNTLLGVNGEKEFSGLGVSYCATCDGAFFRNKTVAVVGGGDVAVEDAIFLARGCSKVYLIHRRDELRAVKVLQQKLFELDNVEVIWDTVVKEIKGKEQVNSIIINNLRQNVTKELQVDGIFIAVGTTPQTELVKNSIELDEKGYIIADETGMTNIDGVVAGGDVRTKGLRQIITAAGDGANCIYSVEKYIWNNF